MLTKGNPPAHNSRGKQVDADHQKQDEAVDIHITSMQFPGRRHIVMVICENRKEGVVYSFVRELFTSC